VAQGRLEGERGREVLSSPSGCSSSMRWGSIHLASCPPVGLYAPKGERLRVSRCRATAGPEHSTLLSRA
jgi:hypothetical protein